MWMAGGAIAVAIIGGLFGWAGSKFARRKDNADATKTIVDTALSMLAPLSADIAKLQGRVSSLESEKARLEARISDLERDNRNLRSENTGLRQRVTSLEKQILDLGHTPVNGSPAVTTTTTEITTIKQESQP